MAHCQRSGASSRRRLAAPQPHARTAANDRNQPKRHHSTCAKAKSPSNCRSGSTRALYFIGHIRTPWKRREDCPKNPRESDETVCTIVLDPRWAQGLQGLETVSHVVVLYWMDRARRDLVLQAPHHYPERRGTFALRSPVRPNPIAVSVARLVGIDGNDALGGRARLSRRHAAPRHQALFRFDRLRPGRVGRLACRDQTLKDRPLKSLVAMNVRHWCDRLSLPNCLVDQQFDAAPGRSRNLLIQDQT